MAQLGLLGLRPPRVAMGTTLIAAAAHLFLPLQIHGSATTIAATAGIGGLALMLRAWWLFRQAGTAICPTERSTELVTHDVFSVSRNPMYLGMVIMILAAGIATGSAVFYLAALAFGVFIDRVFCRHEEEKAAQEFGDEYRRYMRSVRRWI